MMPGQRGWEGPSGSNGSPDEEATLLGMVCTATAMLVTAIPATLAGLGVTLQLLAAGAPEQLKETAPVNPVVGLIAKL